jgi:hypothetical protein
MGGFEKHPGRPPGSHNKLTKRIREDFFKIWCEPIAEGSDVSTGVAAMRSLARENPARYLDFCKCFVPKDITVETSAFAELDNQRIEELIEIALQNAGTDDEETLEEGVARSH